MWCGGDYAEILCAGRERQTVLLSESEVRRRNRQTGGTPRGGVYVDRGRNRQRVARGVRVLRQSSALGYQGPRIGEKGKGWVEVMTNFIPEQPKSAEVPYFDDASSTDGWQGQATEKTIERLKSDLILSLNRLGGTVTGFQKGSFDTGQTKREGFRIHYMMENTAGGMIPGRIDIAALPVRYDSRTAKSFASRSEKSLKMALYMLKISIDGLWFLQQLSPGYAPLMPFMLAQGGKTVSQMYLERQEMYPELPAIEGEFVEKS